MNTSETKACVSVIIPVYNGEEFLSQALDSVLAQTYRPIEIIVVDDGSTDSTARIAQSYIEKNGIKFTKKVNGGQASARNVGLSLATGKYIAFLDADDIWLPDKLAQQIALLEKDNADICYCDAKRFGEAEEDFSSNIKMFEDQVLAHLLKENFIVNSSVVMKRSLVDRIGNLNETTEYRAIEDYEYWLRAALMNAKFSFLAEKKVFYRVHPAQSSKNGKQTLRKLMYMYGDLLKKNVVWEKHVSLLCFRMFAITILRFLRT